MKEEKKRSLEELLVLGFHDKSIVEKILAFWEKTSQKTQEKCEPKPIVDLLSLVSDKKLTVRKTVTAPSKTDLAIFKVHREFSGDNLFVYIAKARDGKTGYELNALSFDFGLVLEAIRRTIVLSALAADNNPPPARAGDDQAGVSPVGLAALSQIDSTPISLNEADQLCQIIGSMVYVLNPGSENPVGKLAETWKPTGRLKANKEPELERILLDNWSDIRSWANDFIGRD